MKTLRLLLLPLLVAGVAVAQKQTLRQEFDSIYKNWITAYQRKNVPAVANMLDPEFKWVMHDGKELKRSDAEAAMKAQFDSIQDGRWAIRFQNVMGNSTVANIMVEVTFVGTLLDPGKKPYKARITSTERHIWFRTADGWKQHMDEVISSKTQTREGTSSSADVEPAPGPDWISAVPPRPGEEGLEIKKTGGGG